MTTVKIHEAKTQLSKLIARVEAGEEIVISRGSQPVAELVALTPPEPKKRKFGAFAGQLPPIPDAFFFDPLPEEELRLWWGERADDPAG